jgi:hypothetical protein
LGRLLFDLPDLRSVLLHVREANQRHHAVRLDLQETLHNTSCLKRVEINVSNQDPSETILMNRKVGPRQSRSSEDATTSECLASKKRG